MGATVAQQLYLNHGKNMAFAYNRKKAKVKQENLFSIWVAIAPWVVVLHILFVVVVVIFHGVHPNYVNECTVRTTERGVR